MVLPFGKYRGLDVTDAPTQYLQWLADQDWLRNSLRSAIEDELERRAGMGSRSGPPVKINTKIADSIIRAGVRAMSKTHHPDLGGDHELMVRINTTADTLRAMIAECG
jgi:Putative quorum-sensing-regulated virulence factor